LKCLITEICLTNDSRGFNTLILYSQVVCAVDRPLSPEEKQNLAPMVEQVKLIAGKVSVAETETAAE
jgi:hypothetical protein